MPRPVHEPPEYTVYTDAHARQPVGTPLCVGTAAASSDRRPAAGHLTFHHHRSAPITVCPNVHPISGRAATEPINHRTTNNSSAAAVGTRPAGRPSASSGPVPPAARHRDGAGRSGDDTPAVCRRRWYRSSPAAPRPAAGRSAVDTGPDDRFHYETITRIRRGSRGHATRKWRRRRPYRDGQRRQQRAAGRGQKAGAESSRQRKRLRGRGP